MSDSFERKSKVCKGNYYYKIKNLLIYLINLVKEFENACLNK